MIKNIIIATTLSLLLAFNSCVKKEIDNTAEAIHISNVKILDGPFLQAQMADLEYILALDVDRLLAPFLKDAGIKPMKENYSNWENTGLDGHIGGHYLSALALMYVNTGDKNLLDRINYMLTWLGRCQDKNGNGYVGGIPYGQKIWNEIADGKINAGTFSLNQRWVPLYNIHKIFAGLYDVYYLTGEEHAKDILIKLTDWFYETTNRLTDEQIQTMLISEHGGLNEVFALVYEISGDQKYLEMAKRFSHEAILNPLLRCSNELTGLHANTQIPKVIGFMKYAMLTQNKKWSEASEFFWNTVLTKWTISIGGNSVREHFHEPNDFSSMVESEQGPESCNTYNMLKLTKLLFLNNPNAKYVDYYERALFNHILSTEHPTKGGFVYFTPMRPQHYRVYSQPQQGFWCCVGSGLENPGRYGEMIYAKAENELFVNMFMASELNWKEKNVVLEQQTQFPYTESTTLVIKKSKPQRFKLNIRYPKWIKEGTFNISINGNTNDAVVEENGYVSLSQKWETNDTIAISFKMKTYAEYLPDSSQWVSFLHGPIVLAAVSDSSNLVGLWADDSRMGHVANGPKYPLDKAPAIVIDDLKDIESVIETDEATHMRFKINNLVNTDIGSMVLQPFYEIHEARYIIYWPVSSTNEYDSKQAQIAQEERQQQELAKRTIDMVLPGEQQPESDHFIKFESSRTGIFRSRHWRHAEGFFSYRFKNPGAQECLLRVTYYGADKGRKFNIFVNNTVIAKVVIDGSYGDKFVDIDYPIPAAAINKSGGKPIEIKFAPEKGNVAGGVFEVRLMTIE